MLSRTRGSVVAVLAAVGMCASASVAGITGEAITITATGSAGTGSWYCPLAWLTPVANQPGTSSWASTWSTPLELHVGNNPNNPLIARCTSMSVEYDFDPRVKVSFNVDAGVSDTTFLISSAIVTFAADTYVTTGSYQMGMTDNNSTGSSMTGLYGTGNAFHWLCNGTELGQGISSFTGGVDQSPTSSGNITVQNVSGAASMQAEYNFTLSANDTATGSATYIKSVVVPAPGAATLLGLGGLIVARRRR